MPRGRAAAHPARPSLPMGRGPPRGAGRAPLQPPEGAWQVRRAPALIGGGSPAGLGARLRTGVAGEARRNGRNRRPGRGTSRIAGAGQRPGVRPDAGGMLWASAARPPAPHLPPPEPAALATGWPRVSPPPRAPGDPRTRALVTLSGGGGPHSGLRSLRVRPGPAG